VPRLIPRRSRDRFFIATREIPNPPGSDSLRPVAYRGEVVVEGDPRLRHHPQALEEAATAVKSGTAPGPDETAAVAQASFTTADGRLVLQGARLHPWDELVRAHPTYFHAVTTRL
jgi:hypothetical protein